MPPMSKGEPRWQPFRATSRVQLSERWPDLRRAGTAVRLSLWRVAVLGRFGITALVVRGGFRMMAITGRQPGRLRLTRLIRYAVAPDCLA